MKIKELIVLMLFALVLFAGCGIYNYTSRNYHEIYTISISQIKNIIKTHSPVIDYEITRRLEDKVGKHPDLKLTGKDGYYQLSGSITNYDVKSFSVGANDETYLNRVTLEMNVQLLNQLENNKSTNKKIVVFADYDAKRNFGEVKDSINSLLSEKAAKEVYDKLFQNW